MLLKKGDVHMELNNITVTDISGAFTVYSPRGRRERMSCRESYGLTLCQSGQITYTQDGVDYVSCEGKIVILPKGQSYTIRGDADGLFPVINFDCKEPLSDRIEVIDTNVQDSLLRDFEQIKQLSLQDGSRAKIFSLFYDMLSKIGASKISGELIPAISYINLNYNNPHITNASIASECRISEVYFRKLFRSQFGISPKQYIIDMRIEHARQLLSEGVLKISAISEECGFASPYHFCRAFKQHTGITASEYSKRNKIRKI